MNFLFKTIDYSASIGNWGSVAVGAPATVPKTLTIHIRIFTKKTKEKRFNGSKGWHQWLRPHRTQCFSRIARQSGDRVRRRQRSDRAETLAHLLKYDSILGNLHHKIAATDDSITIDGKPIKVFAERDPAKLDWASVGAQVVVESTGLFTDAAKARRISGTVKKVIISAPATNEDITIVLGVNEDKYDAGEA